MLDTLEFAERLESGGVPREQAETIAKGLRDALEKGDAASRHDVEKVRTDLRQEIAEFKSELIKWNVGTMLAMTGLFVAIVKFL